MATLKFHNGCEMPQIGFGTWQSKPGEVATAVKCAIDAGYRHIDCAYVYGNEKEVGEALTAKFADGTVKREDIFITSKLWNTYHRKDLVSKALAISLERLGLEYLDLYLIHWPMAYKEDAGDFPKTEEGKFIFSDVHFMDTWKEMENLVDAGKIKSIGLSNFNSLQIQEVIDNGRIKPANLQIEVNPYLSQDKLVAFCAEKGIVVTGYSPLGSPARPWAKPEDPTLLEDPKVVAIAERLKRTPAQVVLRWAVQRGISTIPKSVTEARIKANLEVFDFSLSDDDMIVLHSFDDETHRVCALSWVSDHPLFPFRAEF
ncbi:aldo-keto reductase family 1 member B1-like [Watersipora subatra]|uniref:aldo-keto reductase family 1 member B1-like n=1 Tax=Watersipora subatra TaxID=2589382 RepID=UPI00355C32F8